MVVKNKADLLTASKVAQKLDISVATLNNGYGWYNDTSMYRPDNCPELPMYIQATPHGPRYWDQEALTKLRRFKRWIPKGRAGVMGAYNAKAWGLRGKRALENKRTDHDE